MDIEKRFHMTQGTGEHSYAQNSSMQKRSADMLKHMAIEAAQQVYVSLSPKSFGIADLGCSSGLNSLSFIKDILEAIDALENSKNPAPEEIRICLNDLPSNDFNSVFKLLPDFYGNIKKEKENRNIFIAGCPGSFYGRLFPTDSLHFVYSSFSLHWLSKVPPLLYEEGKAINKGKIYISEVSPASVSEAYLVQFQEDFSLFLQSRSKEVVSGGYMVLILLGRIGPDHVDRGNYLFWELLSRSLAILVSQGKIEEEKLDHYDAHFYAPTKDEIEAEIRKEGSFELVQWEIIDIEKDDHMVVGEYGREVASTVRAIQEPMMFHHFGDEILDSLFEIYAGLVDEEIAKGKLCPIAFALVLRKL